MSCRMVSRFWQRSCGVFTELGLDIRGICPTRPSPGTRWCDALRPDRLQTQVEPTMRHVVGGDSQPIVKIGSPQYDRERYAQRQTRCPRIGYTASGPMLVASSASFFTQAPTEAEARPVSASQPLVGRGFTAAWPSPSFPEFPSANPPQSTHDSVITTKRAKHGVSPKVASKSHPSPNQDP